MTEVSPMWRLDIAKVADINCIINDWCADENINVARPSGEDPEVFKVGQRARVLRLISACPCVVIRPTSAWFAQHKLQEDPSRLFGWACYSIDHSTLRPIVHFLYIKAEHRRQGHADRLLNAAGVRPEKGAWCTTSRLRLRKALEARSIVWNRFLLDYDPAAKPQKKTYA